MFHEVGAVDSIVDVCSVAICLDDLGIEDIVVESLSEGHGTIHCAHGLMPIPVPAVVNLCQAGNIALTPAPVAGELVTPTAPPSSPRCARPTNCPHATASKPSATAPANAPTKVAPVRSAACSFTRTHSHGCPQGKKPRCHRYGVLRAPVRERLRQDHRRRHHRSCHVGRATFYGLFKSKDDLLAELVRDICTHALDDDGTPLDDPLVQVEHILNNLWNRRQGVRALVAGAGSRVFADCLRKTIMSRAAETVPVDPSGPAGTMDRSFLLHHIASSFVGMVQWWAWHNFQADKAEVAKDYLSAIKPLFN